MTAPKVGGLRNGGGRSRPRLMWPTIMTLPAFIALLALGTWQLQRLEWKDALIAERRAQVMAPPIVLPAEISDPAALEYRPVRLSGRFLHARELHFAARVREGRLGFEIVTPMILDDGRAILVNRGWVPPERKDPASRAEGQTGGRVTLVGFFRTGGWKGSATFRPENQPDKNTWLWPDLPAMAAAAELEQAVTSLYVVAAPGQSPGGLPIGRQVAVELKRDHLQYAIVWYTLAFVLLVI